MDRVQRQGAVVLFAAAACAYLLDRLTKVWVERTLPGSPIELIPNVLTLRFTTNSGGAFSIGGSTPWIFVTATIVVSLIIVATAFRHRTTLPAVALGLILGGALGNLTDRIVRGPGFSGRVVDFIDLQVWPIFNVADSAIVVGAVLLAVGSMRSERREPDVEPDPGAPDPS